MKITLPFFVRMAEAEEMRMLINCLGESLMTALTDLQAKVAANTQVVSSAIDLIQGLKAKLDEAIASGDPAQLQALSDELASSDATLAAAVAANTPAAPAEPTP